VVFSPDGILLDSGLHDKTVWIWNVETGETVHGLTGYLDWMRSVTFSPDCVRLEVASGLDDKTIRI
jgi:WD40 repeat protein